MNSLPSPSLCIALAAIALASPANAGADEAAAGRIKADQVCANCHGLDGQAASGGNSAMSPKLTAQRKAYLVARLRAYRSGAIEHPQMTLVARMISEADIDNVAAWYASLETRLGGNAVRADSALAPGARAGKAKAAETCEACHGIAIEVSPATEPAPILVGQPREYLTDRLAAYRNGRLEHAIMTPIALTLSADDIAHLAEWYSGIEVEVTGID